MFQRNAKKKKNNKKRERIIKEMHKLETIE